MPVETRSNVDQEIRTLVDGFAKRFARRTSKR
jgi:hypothetical protein